MFRHVVMMRWAEGATDEQIEFAIEGVLSLREEIPEIGGFEAGRDAGVSAGNADLVIVADFDSEADYLTYATHPAHLKVIAERIRPIVAERHAVQYARPKGGIRTARDRRDDPVAAVPCASPVPRAASSSGSAGARARGGRRRDQS